MKMSSDEISPIIISKFVITANGVTGERFKVCVSHNCSIFAKYTPAFADSRA